MMNQIYYNRVQDQNMHQVSCNRPTVNYKKDPGPMFKTISLKSTLYDGIYSLISLIVKNEQRDGPNPLSL